MPLCVVVRDDSVGSLLTSLLPGGAAGAGGWKMSECLGSHTARRLVSAATEISFIYFLWCCLWRGTVQTLWDVVFLISCWLAGLLSARSAVALDGNRVVSCLLFFIFAMPFQSCRWTFWCLLRFLEKFLIEVKNLLSSRIHRSHLSSNSPRQSSGPRRRSSCLVSIPIGFPFLFHFRSISIPRSWYSGWHSFSHILQSQLSKYHHSSC